MKYILLGLSLLSACTSDGASITDDRRLGGTTTIDERSPDTFDQPAPNLAHDLALQFDDGDGPFTFHWPAFQLGPLFNSDACTNCHTHSGRGRPDFGPDQSHGLVRVSLDLGTPLVTGGDVPVPGFGLQLQDHAETGVPEVTVAQRWVEHTETLGDGTTVMLRAPVLDIRTLDGQPLSSEIRTSFRQGLPLIGLGLLDAITEDAIQALADAHTGGIAGRPNLVWDAAQHKTVIGRFGHKANEPTLRQQVADAFANDIGITSSVDPSSDGSAPEINDLLLDSVVLRLSLSAVSAAAPATDESQHGRQLFDRFGCASCHVATLTTGDAPQRPELAHQTIHPFTDLLLHDMGDGLADGRRDFVASGSEWRTAPLWGVGLAQVIDPDASFLHDGRARTLTEAILWHGGQAQPAREAFRAAVQVDRDALLAFLGSL